MYSRDPTWGGGRNHIVFDGLRYASPAPDKPSSPKLGLMLILSTVSIKANRHSQHYLSKNHIIGECLFTFVERSVHFGPLHSPTRRVLSVWPPACQSISANGQIYRTFLIVVK